ncbi:MAG: Tol-Pal system beta propeller repeat protein TolB [Chlorobiaceae bacterium]|jgi:TolB protein|nr:Tol-Pal system beta propeller repeat protein TolB [Chlorobiaceae bacterium]
MMIREEFFCKMTGSLIKALLILWCFVSFPSSLLASETGEYIAIRKSGGGKIPLTFDKTFSKGNKESGWADSFDSAVREGLDYSGLFSMIPPPLNVRADGGKGSVNFSALGSVGSEIYAGGRLSKESGGVNLDMEVYETLGGKLIMKKSYSGSENDLRKQGNAFCADLIELLTGKKSLFGSKIVFVSNKTGFKEIYQCDFNGQNIEQLTNTKSISLTPGYSPDGKYLAFTDYTTGRPALHIRNMSDRRDIVLEKNGVSIDPGWRNGRELATTLSYEGDQELYLCRTDGTVSRRLTTNKGIDLSPTFSPDGSKMAFVSSRNGLPQIFIMDVSSGVTRRLTFSGRYNTQPSWSPSGDKIAYSTWEKSGEINIFTINADGTGLKRLTSGSKENEAPSWSPDGSMIVFASNRQGNKKLFVMGSGGESQKRLLQMDGEQMQPSWSLFR